MRGLYDEKRLRLSLKYYDRTLVCLLAALAAETALLVYLGGKAVSAWARGI